MSEAEKLCRLVEFAFTKPREVGEENFAGDPLVSTFCELLRSRHQIDFQVFVAWACPPDVKILQSQSRKINAIIRSERLDTLLVEYFQQRRFFSTWEEELGYAVTDSGVLRWMCEFFIGYRQPELAIFAQTLRPKLDGISITNPFRDETLASLPMFERTALQCFSIAHEFGHLLLPRRAEVTLDELVDGISIAHQMETGERQESGNLPQEILRHLSDVRAREIDAPTLSTRLRSTSSPSAPSSISS